MLLVARAATPDAENSRRVTTHSHARPSAPALARTATAVGHTNVPRGRPLSGSTPDQALQPAADHSDTLVGKMPAIAVSAYAAHALPWAIPSILGLGGPAATLPALALCSHGQPLGNRASSGRASPQQARYGIRQAARQRTLRGLVPLSTTRTKPNRLLHPRIVC
jgi:hypothetical protein